MVAKVDMSFIIYTLASGAKSCFWLNKNHKASNGQSIILFSVSCTCMLVKISNAPGKCLYCNLPNYNYFDYHHD